MFTSSGSTGGRRRGGDAKTIISLNTLFGDIMTTIKLHYVKFYEFLTLLKIGRVHSTKSYLVIIDPNSREKFTQMEISLSRIRLEHCS